MRMNMAGPGEKWKTPIGEFQVEDYKIYSHRNGRIFIRYLLHDLLDEIAEDMRKNIRDDYDNVVIVDGGEGSGKSNLMYQLLTRYDPNFDMLRGYTYDAEAFRAKICEGGDIGRTFWMDEGSIIANNRDWNSTNNKSFIKVLETCRSRHYTLGICIPSFDRLDIYIREHRVRYLLHCEPMDFMNGGMRPRGYCEVRKRNDVTGQLELIGYAAYNRMPEEAAKVYKELKSASQAKLFEDLYGEDADDSPGAKYKKKYEEGEAKLDTAMLRLYESGVELEELQEMFSIKSKKTLQNRLSKARKRGEA